MKVTALPIPPRLSELDNESVQVLINYYNVQKQNLLNNSEDVKKFNDINEKLQTLLKSNVDGGSVFTPSTVDKLKKPKTSPTVVDSEYPKHGSIISRVRFILFHNPNLTANEIATKMAEIEKMSKAAKQRITQSVHAALNSGFNSKTKQFSRKEHAGSSYIYTLVG